MATTKQFVFVEALTNIHLSNSYPYEINNRDISPQAAGPGGSWTAIGSTSPSGASADLYRKTVSNSSGNSETLTFPWGDALTSSILIEKNGMSATKCRAEFTNGHVFNSGNVFYGVYGFGNPGYFPVTYDFEVIQEVSGSDVTSTFQVNDQLGFSYSSPNNADWPSTVNTFVLHDDHIIQGSDVTGGAKNTLSSLESKSRIGSYNTPGNFSNYVFQFNPSLRFDIQLSWEGNLITIDASDSSHTLPAFNVVSSISADAGILQVGSADLTSNVSITEDSVNIKDAGQIDSPAAFTFTSLAGLVFNQATTITTISNCIPSIANLRFADSAISSAFTFEDVAIAINAGSIINPTFTATTQGNIKTDITGDYAWNSLSNNPFVDSGYVKGGYTDDAEYEWDDLLSADGSADATWDTWTYGTWLGDETGWDDWPNGAWASPFTFESTFTQADTPTLFKLGGVFGVSTAFAITEDVALKEAAEADLTAAFAFEGTSSGVISADANLIAAFTTTVSDVDYLENITSDELDTFSCTFSTSFIGNVKTNTSANISGALGFAVSDTVIYGALSTPPSTFTTNFAGVLKHDSSSTLLASLAQSVIARLNVPADFFNTFFVPQETRVIVIPEEQRQYTVSAESRLNNINTETRVHKVEQETRSYKLPYVPITNRFITPKTRSK